MLETHFARADTLHGRLGVLLRSVEGGEALARATLDVRRNTAIEIILCNKFVGLVLSMYAAVSGYYHSNSACAWLI